jgi:hypothetical protein
MTFFTNFRDSQYIKVETIDWKRNQHGRDEQLVQNFDLNFERMRLLKMPGHRGRIYKYVKARRQEIDLIHQIRHEGQWLTVCNKFINPQVLQMMNNFLTS